MAALLEAEKLKANESGVNGAALPEGWVDLSMIEDRILQFFDRAFVGHTHEDVDQYFSLTRQYMRRDHIERMLLKSCRARPCDTSVWSFCRR